MPQKKYLVIGSAGHQYVDCVEWKFEPLPNIVDYDIVIVNVRSLTDEFLENVSSERIDAFHTLFTRFLASNGVLLIISDFKRVVKRPNKYPNSYNNYCWCPVAIGIRPESGTTIKFITRRFRKYFSKFKKWDYYFFIPIGFLKEGFTRIIGSPNETNYELPSNILITNRYGKMLSGTISFQVFYRRKKTTPYSSRTTYVYPDEPDRTFGEIVLLPLIEELESKNAINLLLEDLIGKPQVPLPPDWTSEVKMPFIEDYELELKSLSDKIENIQTKVKEVEDKKKEVEDYKKLLYSDGMDLENIFKKCLIELGAEVEPAKYSDEEYCLVYKDIEYPVEAKGNSKSISLTNLRQLIDYPPVLG